MESTRTQDEWSSVSKDSKQQQRNVFASRDSTRTRTKITRTKHLISKRLQTDAVRKTLKFYSTNSKYDKLIRQVTRKLEPSLGFLCHNYIWPFWLLQKSQVRMLKLDFSFVFRSLCEWSINRVPHLNERWIHKILQIFYIKGTEIEWNFGHIFKGSIGSALGYAIYIRAEAIARILIIHAKSFHIDLDVKCAFTIRSISSPVRFINVQAFNYLALLGRMKLGTLYSTLIPRLSKRFYNNDFHSFYIYSSVVFGGKATLFQLLKYVMKTNGQTHVDLFAHCFAPESGTTVLGYLMDKKLSQFKEATEAKDLYLAYLKIQANRLSLAKRILKTVDHSLFHFHGPYEIVATYYLDSRYDHPTWYDCTFECVKESDVFLHSELRS